jgi:hypothetical protein
MNWSYGVFALEVQLFAAVAKSGAAGADGLSGWEGTVLSPQANSATAERGRASLSNVCLVMTISNAEAGVRELLVTPKERIDTYIGLWCSSLQLQNSCPAVAGEPRTANIAIQRLLIFS